MSAEHTALSLNKSAFDMNMFRVAVQPRMLNMMLCLNSLDFRRPKDIYLDCAYVEPSVVQKEKACVLASRLVDHLATKSHQH